MAIFRIFMPSTSHELEAVEPNPPASADRIGTLETSHLWQHDSQWHYVRIGLAVLFSAAMVLYSLTWMYHIRKGPITTFGMRVQYDREAGARIAFVAPDSEAALAGVQQGDIIVEIDGHRVRSMEPVFTVLTLAHPGDRVHLVLKKPDGQTRDVDLTVTPEQPFRISLTELIATELVISFPVPFVLVAVPVLFLRVNDRNAWKMAICFAGMIAAAPLAQIIGLMPGWLRSFMAAYMLTFFLILPAAFYNLFATFPAQAPLDRRFPRLKKTLLFGALAVALPLAAYASFNQSLESLWPLVDFVGKRQVTIISAVYGFGSFTLALISLFWNNLYSHNLEARRKTRVMVWGTIVGNLPWLCLQLISVIFHLEPYNLPFWIWAPCVIMIYLMPLSFAYAVLKHRVLDVPVLLRRSARYLLVQRGSLILIFVLGTGATLALAQSFAQHYPARAGAAIPIGAIFGIALVIGGTWIQQRVSHRLDKAFFRSAYDTRQVLEDLLAKTREVRTREQLCELLTSNLTEALHPSFLLIYLTQIDRLTLWPPSARELAPPTLPHSSLLDELYERSEPHEVLGEAGSSELARIGAEYLVPISGRDRQRLALLVLGPRLSEEPYSREDRRLLTLIAASAGDTLEHIALAEDIAARMEAEKRAAHEIELARQVQRKLFPQNPPRLQHLDYAGECVQARVVGGDYYDFLELAPGQVGFALADISGKGFPAALLMANLQANLRGQYALALDDLPGLMRSVNRLFCENSEPQHYATMFFGVYDDRARKLRYVNCGHNPPLVIRADGSHAELSATATVMGLFPKWDCDVAEFQLSPGDTFVMYTDGVTEASNPAGEEFGEERAMQTISSHPNASASEMLRILVHTIQQFSPGEQGDDLTAVIGRVR